MILIVIATSRVAIHPAPASAYSIQKLPPLPPAIMAPTRPRPVQPQMPAAQKTTQPAATQPAMPENPHMDELINGPHKSPATMPASAPAADIDDDLPMEEFVKIKVLKARDEFGDMHGIIQRPPGWVISSVEVAIFPDGHPENRKSFTVRTWTRPDEPSDMLHLYVRNVRSQFTGHGPIKGFTWAVLTAKGHRTR